MDLVSLAAELESLAREFELLQEREPNPSVYLGDCAKRTESAKYSSICTTAINLQVRCTRKCSGRWIAGRLTTASSKCYRNL